MQGVNGVLQMLVALPAGYLADRHRRDTMLRAGAAVCAVAGAVLACALMLRPTVWMLGAAMALLGCYRGIYSAALEAIFADSIMQGRSGLYTRKYAVTVAASSCGPWISLALFHHLGNRWVAEDCRLVLLSGVTLMAVPLALMCAFDDDKTVAHGQEQQGQGREPMLPTTRSNGNSGTLTGPALEPPADQICQADGSATAAVDGAVVTVLVSVSDFIGTFASGMTIKFFAMYFMQSVLMTPAAVSLIGALSPIGVCAASLACQPLSNLFTRCLDILLLAAMAFLPTATAPARHLLVAVHLLRMAVANATRPLMRSVLMDFVPRRHRGKVNAVDSVRSFSWSGSAALGGFLIERIGFRRTFLVTAAIKTAAFVPLLLLLAYVPDGICLPAGTRLVRMQRLQRWQGTMASAAVAAAAPSSGGAGGNGCQADGLRQPLLDKKAFGS
ncbi:hypothetical protein CHLNCDRAFT_138179 [Chlorella variabilis]|uniref:Major facilitator superfamily (MFS) profile domain-containing protein n=1 Tax=Chlorella variabilis TaxID=554065 RepID=E1Z3R3_CHLVA|nr:hypothetical protein CHLNCDRAFT_138179 [Chlorella variabilis]EFN59526.1 hypothetical protein CHLNCDRAFT_138179 [Chlorella variabilis]|eukprot:XP_005851628.1 hypothetical protein CHLNCDRAFT_138179 [Chlorella variabilis]